MTPAAAIRLRSSPIPRLVSAVCWLLAVTCVPAAAQSAADARPLRRVEAAIGAGLFGGAAVGSADANIRANNPVAEPYRLFSTATRFASAPSFEARVGVDLTRRFGVEGRFGFSRPELQTSVTADTEDVPPLTVVERVNQYLIEGAVVVMLDELRLRRVVPFATAGTGYLRQLHEGLTVIEQGHAYHVGGGVKYWLFTRERGALRAAGLRVDARWYVLVGGFAIESGPKSHGALSGSFFITF